jgi:predicted restriction endonuclease
MKCCNLASLDTTHQARGVKGLRKAAAIDRAVWAEFQSNPDAISYEAATALASLESRAILPPNEPDSLPHEGLEGKERERVIRVRVNQYFFRHLILAGYGETCAVCGLPLPPLLVASHIIPWSVDATERMNPRNGICLCGTHDRAYERGLLRIQPDFVIRVRVAARFRTAPSVRDWLLRFEGEQIRLPQRWHPDPVLLARKLALVSDDDNNGA